MPEIYDPEITQATVGEQALIGYGLPSAPSRSFDVPIVEQPQLESIFHPVKALEDIIAAIQHLTQQVSLLVKDLQRERTFMDSAVQIGATIPYVVEYNERKYLYALSATALTLNVSSGGTIALVANTWKNLSLPRGTLLTVQGGSDAAPAVVIIRACDVPMI